MNYEVGKSLLGSCIGPAILALLLDKILILIIMVIIFYYYTEMLNTLILLLSETKIYPVQSHLTKFSIGGSSNIEDR